MTSLVDFVITVPVLILVLGRMQTEEQHAEPPPEAGRLQELHQEGHKTRYGRQVELEATQNRHGRQVNVEASKFDLNGK
jgi:hypothetical protein